jgi:hypothetical protein
MAKSTPKKYESKSLMIKFNALNCLLKFKAIFWVELKLQINASNQKLFKKINQN